MATAFASATSASKEHSGGTDSITINIPASTASGDLLVAVVGINGAANEMTATGWTALFTTNTGTNAGIRCFYRVADGTEGASVAFSQGAAAGAGMAGWIARITGASFAGSANITSTSDFNTVAATNHTFTPGITPATTNSVYLMGSFARGDCTQSTYAITNNNPTWTERVDEHTAAFTTDVGLSLATATPSAASGSGDYSLVLSASQEACGFLLNVTESASVTVSPSVVTMTGSINAPTVAGGAIVSPAVIGLQATINAPTVTTPEADWKNPDKTSDLGWVNPNKT
ncbi:hypothetical protein C4568_03790 [Candidatus Parcubacteria bacterium]|nr:MAG: hypothetical protein C4568_03790 [Candidatus Parcubacteria bacterium]